MSGITLVLFILGCIGLTHFVVDSPTLRYIRSMLKFWLPDFMYAFVACYECFGLISGTIMGWLLFGQDWNILVACACAGSFLSNLSAVLLNLFEARSAVYIDQVREEKK